MDGSGKERKGVDRKGEDWTFLIKPPLGFHPRAAPS
jgi:hypothetical protein